MKELFQSPSRQKLEQFATKCCQLHICHDVQEKIGEALYGLDMSIKGVAYQAHYHQSQSQTMDVLSPFTAVIHSSVSH